MYISSEDNSIHGSKYYIHGYNGSSHIETTCGNTTGTENVMNGIKPKYLAEEILCKLKSAQIESYMGMLLSSIIGNSANSDNLYLYATTTSKLYKKHFSPAISDLKTLLDAKGTDFERFGRDNIYELRDIVWCVSAAFHTAAEMYHEEIQPEHFWDPTFTPLDIFMCTKRWMEFYINEYKINGLK